MKLTPIDMVLIQTFLGILANSEAIICNRNKGTMQLDKKYCDFKSMLAHTYARKHCNFAGMCAH